MTISDYQINSVIRTYMKNMKVKVRQMEEDIPAQPRDDQVTISENGIKKMLFERMGEQMIERIKQNDEA